MDKGYFLTENKISKPISTRNTTYSCGWKEWIIFFKLFKESQQKKKLYSNQTILLKILFYLYLCIKKMAVLSYLHTNIGNRVW